MKPVLRFQGFFGVITTMVMLLHVLVHSANPTRVDFYDKSQNHLMYLMFHYEGERLTGRTLYMADGTFKREVNLVTGPTGARVSETSFDFNGDTSFVTKYSVTGSETKFTINDQFKLDHLGGPVKYAAADGQKDFMLNYDNGDFASHIQYETLADGTPTKVLVYDQNNVMQYYGEFSSVGVKESVGRIGGSPQAVISPRGGAGVDLRLNLSAPGLVTCKLMTLSGRVAGVLFNEMVPKGHMLRSVTAGHTPKVASGVYLLVVSVNGKVVSSSRYLSEIAVSGGVQ